MKNIVHFFFFILLLFAATSVHSQSDNWIVKLSQKSYNKILKNNSERSQLVVHNISSALNLVSVTSPYITSENNLHESLTDYEVYNIYPNQTVSIRDRIPDDFLYDDQWNMQVMDLPLVWDHTTGGTTANGTEIVVAVLDDGFQFNHEDVEPNVWINTNEIPNDDIDNDNNGVKDDYRGYNVDTMNDDLSITSHGTKVFGVIAGKGNNGIGVTGVNWDLKILPIGGISNVGEIMTAMDYIIRMKTRYLETNGQEGANIMVSNLSSGIARAFPETSPDWCAFYDMAGEVGILSVSAAPNERFNVDIEGDLPTLCPSEFLITVTNTDMTDEKFDRSGFGKLNVDIGAPGEGVISTGVGSEYSGFSGTSASAPHIAGAAALLFSVKCSELGELIINDPPASVTLIKQCILDGVEQKSTLTETVSGGRANIYNSFLKLAEFCSEDTRGALSIRSSSFVENSLKLSYSTDDYTEYTLSIYDPIGQLVTSSNFTPPLFEDQTISLDLSDFPLPTGMYIANIRNNNGNESTFFFVTN